MRLHSILAISAATCLSILGGGEPVRADALPTAEEVGREYYLRYCAVCHGTDGRGKGDYANLLSVPPTDLTTLAKRSNDGQFPASDLAEVIDGRRNIRAHGDPEMPVWGERFSESDERNPNEEAAVRSEVRFLVDYLRTVQEGSRSATTDSRWIGDAGRRVYAKHCESCHGFWADGRGYLAPMLVTPPADLTRIAERRNAVFPEREIAAIIDGRQGMPAHGSREMPIWGRRLGGFLSSAPENEVAVRGEILLLTEYLRAVQQSGGSPVRATPE